MISTWVSAAEAKGHIELSGEEKQNRYKSISVYLLSLSVQFGAGIDRNKSGFYQDAEILFQELPYLAKSFRILEALNREAFYNI